MKLEAPQILWTVSALLSLGIELALHGDTKPEKKYNFFTGVLSSLITMAWLWWGGFFQ